MRKLNLTPEEKKDRRLQQQASYMRNYRERLAAQGKKTVTKIIKQDDLKQFDLVGDTSGLKLQKVFRVIEGFRNNPKINLYANSNKNLLAFIQQLEEVL